MMSMHMSFMLKKQLWLMPSVFEYMILNLYFILNVISLTHLILTQFKFHMIFFSKFCLHNVNDFNWHFSKHGTPQKLNKTRCRGPRGKKRDKGETEEEREDGSYSVGGETSNIFDFQPYLGKISNLTNIFQMGWFNHQVVILGWVKHFFFSNQGHQLIKRRKDPRLTSYPP